MSGPMSGTSQSGVIDPLDSLLDLSQFENVDSFQSPSLSPETSKTPFLSRQTTAATTSQPLISSQPVMSGPSHQYDAYKQQTGIVPGALANTFAINQNNSQITGYTGFSLDYLGIGQSDDMFDFNASPTQDSADMDMDFDSPSNDATFFFPDSTVNPTALESNTLASPLPAQTSNVGRLWPGMHRQAALAKAQAQQRQQQQIIQQQRQSTQKQTAQRKGVQPSDPIVEQKITQLLNSMRAKPSSATGQDGAPLMNVPRLKKDEEDMDEDERLLASEEGKKLTSKERRQLRNKVSARAFRSRRKGKTYTHPTTPTTLHFSFADHPQSTLPSSKARSPTRSTRTVTSRLITAPSWRRTSASVTSPACCSRPHRSPTSWTA
jgi:bZIP-type transcription factor MBZ1